MSQREEEGSPVYFRPPASPLTSSDVIKKGYLYVKRPPTKRTVRFSIKTWQKKYLVLRDDWKESGTITLDIYDREVEAPGADGKIPALFFFASRPYTVDLLSVTNVDLYLESRSFVHALIVHRSTGFPIILGAESELEMKCWMASIRLLADKANQFFPRLHRPPSCPSHLANGAKGQLKGTLSLASDFNRSTPQLFRVTGSESFKLSAKRHNSSLAVTAKTLDGNYIDVLDADVTRSPRTPVLSDYHAFKKILSTSFFTNLGAQRESGSKWRPFSKMSRKDSGFSESFDESVDQTQGNYSPQEDTVHEEDHASSSTPPPLPPRQISTPLSPLPRTPCLGHEPWFSSCPPKPPPRPIHTLQQHFYYD